MGREAEILLSKLQELQAQQAAHWEENNAVLSRVVPRALGLIHARAAWDIEFAKRLVFDHFTTSGL